MEEDFREMLGKLIDGSIDVLSRFEDMERDKVILEAKKALEKDEDPTIRGNSALVLSHFGELEEIKDVLIGALDDESWIVRHDVAIALGEIGDETVMESLVGLLDDEELEVRKRAVESLGKIEAPEALDHLEKYTDEESLQPELTYALKVLGDDELLINCYRNGNKEVREIAIQALGDRGDNKDILLEALKDGQWRVREEAVKALGRVKGKDVTDSLLNILRKEDNEHVQEAAIKSLSEQEIEEIPSELSEFEEHEKASLRIAWARSIGKIGGEEVLEYLLSALFKEHNPQVKWGIADALSSVVNSNKKLVYEKLDSCDDHEKLMLAYALGSAGDRKGIDHLFEGIEHESWKVRQKSVEALGRIDTKDMNKRQKEYSFKSLLRAMDDTDKWVRASAIKSFAKLADENDDLIKEVKDKIKLESDEDVINTFNDLFSD